MEVLASSSSSVTKSNQLSDVVSEVVEENPNGQISGTPGLKEFSFTDLKTATSDFKPEALLDEGVYGRVYKGWVDEKTLAPTETGTGMAVAIKILNPEIIQAFEQWQLEMNILGRRYHPNLIELLGYCWEDEKLVLVLEFMQKGSLQRCLFQENVEPLPWNVWLKIAIGTARGLAFLHTCEGKVIYRSFNSSNILLDENYTPKLSDFGLAKLWPSVDKSHVTSIIIDTDGYTAPEYITLGHLSMKTDVYTFGIMLLELLMGSRVLDNHCVSGHIHSIDRLKSKFSQFSKLETFMDVKMQGQYNRAAAFGAAQLAVVCLATKPGDRPSMREVLVVLEQIEAMEEKPRNSAPSSVVVMEQIEAMEEKPRNSAPSSVVVMEQIEAMEEKPRNSEPSSVVVMEQIEAMEEKPRNSEPSSVVVMEQIEAMEEKPRNSEPSSVVVGEQIEEMEEKPNNSKLSSPVSTSHCHGQPRIHHHLLTLFKAPCRYLTSKMSCMRMCSNKTEPHVLS